jgi:hypothetical protein
MLGIVARVALGQRTRDDEAGDRQPENQCRCCDVSRPQERTSVR